MEKHVKFTNYLGDVISIPLSLNPQPFNNLTPLFILIFLNQFQEFLSFLTTLTRPSLLFKIQMSLLQTKLSKQSIKPILYSKKSLKLPPLRSWKNYKFHQNSFDQNLISIRHDFSFQFTPPYWKSASPFAIKLRNIIVPHVPSFSTHLLLSLTITLTYQCKRVANGFSFFFPSAPFLLTSD